MANGNMSPSRDKAPWQPTIGKGAPSARDQVDQPYKPPVGKGAPTPFQQDRDRQRHIDERQAYKDRQASGNQGAPDPSLTIRNEWQGMRTDAINNYKGKDLSYNPYQTEAGPRMSGMNYDPYRQAAVNQAQSQAGNQMVSQQSQLQQAGALSGSDRMKAFSDFNRAKIQGTLGANQQYNQLQSQNQLDVDRFNADRDFSVNARNIAAGNDSRQFGAMANNRRDLNLYQDGLQQRNLDRQLEASRIIGNAQMNSSYNPGVFEKILEPVFTGFDKIGEKL